VSARQASHYNKFLKSALPDSFFRDVFLDYPTRIPKQRLKWIMNVIWSRPEQLHETGNSTSVKLLKWVITW